MKKKIDKIMFFKIIFLLGYFLCIVVLLTESSLNGTTSASHSDTVGGGIADMVNKFTGDQTEVIALEKVVINNKINEAKVDEVYKLEIDLFPINATNKSLIYQSSNPLIASISSNGEIKFLDVGEVTFNVISKENDSINDSFSVNVSHIDVTEVSFYINEDLVSEINTLYINKTYQLNMNIYPLNATFKDVSFSVDNSYLSISNDGIITPNNYSNGEITTIKINVGTFTSELKFIVLLENYTPLESIELEQNEYTIFETEMIKIDFSFYPSNATFKDFVLSSNNDNISIDNYFVTGVLEGTSIITISSLYDENISKTFVINICKQEKIMDFEIDKKVIDLNVGSTNQIIIDIKTPNNYALLSSLNVLVENPNVVSINEDFVITALFEGTTNIVFSNYNNSCTKIVTVNVSSYLPPSGITFDDKTKDISINLNKKYLYTNNSYDLVDLIKIKYFDEFGIEYFPNNSELSFLCNNEELKQINISTPGEYLFSVIHLASGITKDIKIIFIDEMQIENLIDETIILNTNSHFKFKILNNYNDYNIILDNKNLGLLDHDESCFTFSSYNLEGNAKIRIIPIYDNNLIDDLEIVLNFEIRKEKLSKLEFNIFDYNTNLPIEVKNNCLNVNMDFANYSFFLKVIANSDIYYDINYQSLDESILVIDNYGNVSLKKAGSTKIVISDSVSSLSKTIDVNVFNVIELDEENPFTISGSNVTIDDDIYHILNGYSGNIILNFSDNSSFKKVTYESSNSKVVSVGSDGTLIPHKAGKATIKLTIDDNISKKRVIEFNLVVDAQKTISDLNSFFYGIRKGIGHFGAFLVFGVFSCFVFLWCFKIKNKIFAILLCFLQGFMLAALTEIIQLFVPGRCGLFSDVLIDYCGFCFSSVIIVIFYLFKLYRKKKAIKE